MKKLKYLVCGSVVALLLASCASDKKDDPGPPSSTDAREQFVGTWLCHETNKTTGTETYTIQITKSGSSSSDILIDHFYGLNTTARATLNGGNNINIPYQQLGTLGFAKGSGGLSTATQLNMTYTTTVGTTQDTCVASCTKQ